MKCPNCNVDLGMAERQGVEIDFCPQCRGIWLEKGKLDKIIDRLLSGEGAPNEQPQATVLPPQPRHGYDSHHDSHHNKDHDKHRDEHGYYDEHGRYRRKSIFEKLFD